MDNITLVALSLSIFSVGGVIALIFAVRGRITKENHVKDPEISAIVSEFNQRLKRLEENIVDQKVKLEILELRAQRGVSPNVQTTNEWKPTPKISTEEPPISYKIPTVMPTPRPPAGDRRTGSTEQEVLRLVVADGGKITAKYIQQKIGRTREHTARLMNELFQEGLVERDNTVRPFTYSITQKGREFLRT